MLATVPHSYNDPQLKMLKRRLNAFHEAFFVNVVSELWALVSDCYPNVKRKVNESCVRMIRSK
jgi:hypothetical protein